MSKIKEACPRCHWCRDLPGCKVVPRSSGTSLPCYGNRDACFCPLCPRKPITASVKLPGEDGNRG